MKGKIAVGPGDGIGPEIVMEGVKVLQAVSRKYGHEFALEYFDTGGIALDKYETSLTEEGLELCRGSDAILLGAVGGPKWDYRANLGLLRMRREFGLFANLRPVKVFPAMVNCSTVKQEVVRDVDLMVLRENTGGVYFGQPKKQWQSDEGRMAVDSMVYSEHEIERIIRVGFELARTRRKKLTSAAKENVLETSRLWRKLAEVDALAEGLRYHSNGQPVRRCAQRRGLYPGWLTGHAALSRAVGVGCGRQDHVWPV